MRGNDFVKVLYMFEVCVYRFLYFRIFMRLRLFTIFMPSILLYTCSFVNHFSSYPFLWGSFPLFTYAGDHNSYFNWILLCLIFYLCWLYESLDTIKTFFVSFLSQLPWPNKSIHLVSVWSFISPFELLSISIFIWTWCLSMSV